MLNVKRVYGETGKLVEKYDVTATGRPGGGGEYPTQDGFGWTNGVMRELMALYPVVERRSGSSAAGGCVAKTGARTFKPPAALAGARPRAPPRADRDEANGGRRGGQGFGAGGGAGDARDLLHRAVFVVLALDGEHRAADRGKQGFDVPAAKCGVEPDPIPSPERGVDVGVMAAQALRATPFPISRFRRVRCCAR